MLFSAFALAVDCFVTIGRRTAQFCFPLYMRCLFLDSPSLRPCRLLTHAKGHFVQIRTKILRAFGGMMAGSWWPPAWGPLLIVLQSRSLYGRHVSTSFLDSVFGAMMKLFFRPTPYGFRQVVQHVSKHVAYEIN